MPHKWYNLDVVLQLIVIIHILTSYLNPFSQGTWQAIDVEDPW